MSAEVLVFSEYGEKDVPGMRECVKKPVILRAKRMDRKFTVDNPEGTWKRGRPGDYLMMAEDGSLHVVASKVFEENYDFTDAR